MKTKDSGSDIVFVDWEDDESHYSESSDHDPCFQLKAQEKSQELNLLWHRFLVAHESHQLPSDPSPSERCIFKKLESISSDMLLLTLLERERRTKTKDTSATGSIDIQDTHDLVRTAGEPQEQENVTFTQENKPDDSMMSSEKKDSVEHRMLVPRILLGAFCFLLVSASIRTSRSNMALRQQNSHLHSDANQLKYELQEMETKALTCQGHLEDLTVAVRQKLGHCQSVVEVLKKEKSKWDQEAASFQKQLMEHELIFEVLA